MRAISTLCAAGGLLLSQVVAESVSEINGNKYQSSFLYKNVSDVEGLVTAKGPKGFYLRSTSPDEDDTTSDSIYIYSPGGVHGVSEGDKVTLSGKVIEYYKTGYVSVTQITDPTGLKVSAGTKDVEPVVIGAKGRQPPTEQFSSLDGGDILGLPNNASQIHKENPELQPDKYGMDFWESLSGELVTLTGARAISKPNQYGDTWAVGDWKATGRNARGGLTMRPKDSNPEAILIGAPLDETKNPTDTKLGDTIGDITGVITQSYGYYTLLPQTALKVSESNSTAAEPTTLEADGGCKALTVGSYNINNLAPNSTTLPKIAGHIAKELKSPRLLFVQEVQDGSGPTNDGEVSSKKTLTKLVSEIKEQGGVEYDFIDISPEDGKDGGQPGGNIRVAYLYDPTVIRLRDANPGSSSDANEVQAGPALKFNPGLIDPTDSAWDDSRKPLAAAWETVDGKNPFFTINIHFSSKGGGSPMEGDARPPVNGGVEQREAQAKVVAQFVQSILAEDDQARIITSGDFNEFTFAQPLTVFASESGLQELEEAAGIDEAERYTYLYDSNCQQLDHMYVSEPLAKEARAEHIHVNTWVSYDDQGSDHDPTVALLNVCA